MKQDTYHIVVGVLAGSIGLLCIIGMFTQEKMYFYATIPFIISLVSVGLIEWFTDVEIEK